MRKDKNKFLKMWLIPLLLVMIMAGCEDRVGITYPPITTAPTVSSTSPTNASTNVGLNTKIAATFSEPMDSSSISTASFTLMQGNSFVAGTISYAGTTAIYTPGSNLSPNTTYIATLTTSNKSSEGTPLAKNYVWSFTTGTSASFTAPTVSFTDPANNATGVGINKKIAAAFSETMDASTITQATFTLTQGITPVSGFISYSGTTAIFNPAANLAPNTAYTATITTGTKDLAGNSLASNYVWTFTTGAAAVVTPPTVTLTNPANNAAGVGFNSKIAATFSETMNASTITTATFTLMQGSTAVAGTVSYVGSTATFAPGANLLPNTTYTATITTGAQDLAGNALVSNYVWSFTTGAAAIVTPPSVTFTDPANVATGVGINKKIAATFSETMDASTITQATFTLTQGITPVSGFISYSGTTAIFNPAANLVPNTTYTATITTGAKDLAGIALASNYVWTFTTGAAAVVTPPTVTLTNPANNATGVGFNSKIAATFSETMNASTITTATFTLMQGSSDVAGTVSYIGSTATFAPGANLLPNTTYTATITTGAQDLAGIALASNYVWTFTTGAAAIVTPPSVTSTDPANAATGVGFNKKIAATFSEAMDASTITTATFTLMQGNSFVAGTISYSGTTAIYAPGSDLLPNTTYTATITTGAQDLAGIALASNYVWSFTTGAAPVITPPTVTFTDPVNSATGVPLNKIVTATFSETMDASTITTATFTLMQNTTFVSGTVSYSGTTATYTPSSNLLLNTTYTATITTGAKDLAGNSLVSNYVWSFTTTPPQYSVSLSSNPAAGGTTNGGGTYNSGASVTVTATPNAGYTFTNWTENGNGVSTNAAYQFTISGNRTLVANFAAVPVQFNVALSSNPAAGGTTSGGGTFNSGASVTVTATPNANYTFTNWTENGNAVSTNAAYQFTISGNRTLVANFTAASGPIVDLGAAASFGGFGGSAGLTNQGIFTVVNGDIGTTAASTLVTGFHDTGGNVYTETPLNIGTVNGTINCAPPAPGTAAKFLAAQNALAAATTAFNYLKGLPGGPDPGAGELGGLVLAPGTYTAAAGTFKITSGDLTLDAQNNPNAVWVFQMAQSLTVGKAGQPRSIILVNGAQAKNVYWQVGSAATINGAGGGTMAGTIISYSGVTFSTAGNVTLTTLNGRALSLNASVTLVNTVVNVP